MKHNHTLNLGFYAFFAPVSYSADEDPTSPGFYTHMGYESDIFTALESIPDAALSFVRHPIPEWEDVWLKSASPDYDIVGGGITILDSRTMDASGEKQVNFTAGHIAFRQSLLVRADDAERLASHDRLTADVRVGALADTTGEVRLLELTGLVSSDGVLIKGARIETPNGVITSDGSDDYFITSAGESPALANRQRICPPSENMPQVVYLGDELGESELLDALRDGTIDAVARGEIGNREAAAISGGAFVVTALDPAVEFGGFTLDAEDTDLLSYLNERIDWLTDNRNIGYAQWLEDSSVFLRRAKMWDGRPK